MAIYAGLPGFTARAELSAPRRTGGIEVQLVAEYQGDELTGQRFLVRNLGQESLALGSEREGPAGALAFAYGRDALAPGEATSRSEEHTSELQSLMRISYAVFCLKKKKTP